MLVDIRFFDVFLTMVSGIKYFQEVVEDLDDLSFVRERDDVQVLKFGFKPPVGVQNGPRNITNLAAFLEMFAHDASVRGPIADSRFPVFERVLDVCHELVRDPPRR